MMQESDQPGHQNKNNNNIYLSDGTVPGCNVNKAKTHTAPTDTAAFSTREISITWSRMDFNVLGTAGGNLSDQHGDMRGKGSG